ncbi:hypothetical protein [Waterburya agarophytonicola]|uniref:hypothetical protein n=1 Tax=Waterburya agarophytonicola TaxID=2886916 RepID=UPI001E38BC67|nr:hypothetical protein [Waterburya agarophytonicola]
MNSSWLRIFLSSKLFSTVHLSTSIGAIATTVLFSQSVLAESFGGYCIAQKNENNLKQEAREMLSEKEQDLAVTAERKNSQYTITVDRTNGKQLLLQQAGEKNAIDQMTLAPEGGQITDLILGQDDWLWIDRNAIDYMMKVHFAEDTANFDSPVKLPELSAQPCHLLRRLFKKCTRGEYNYSPSLGSVFVSGYPTRSWVKQKYIHLEFISGKRKPIPELLEQATFIADVPEWNGALFRNTTGEALFYDGAVVIDLSQDFLKLQGGENFQDWEVKKTAGGRTFMGKFASRTVEDPLFLMELTPKPGFKPVYLPEYFERNWLEVFTLPQDPDLTLWIVTGKAIFAEIDRRTQILVSLSPLSSIPKWKLHDWMAKQDIESDNQAILFSIQNETNQEITDYLLRDITANTNCEVVLDFEQPIILKEPTD